ncbi:hypothetical protein GE300_19285 [Rhodobacteraceae bacterium 2CG4]|uniref:Lysylphosphatidylglycerol synthase-like protein n=1 Tax=Halovulum marinum TaxID=2662447 RepID=A0A6L5Z585_9RHOB|nr:lysylphosphatidylglycerol synthase domain-containing protein [Halovulum marinum]MSU91726.1 hypothetical protein [Halovulum marinum]
MASRLRIAGTFAALLFMGVALWRGSREMPRINLTEPLAWGWLIAALGFYVMSQLVAAVAWRGALSVFDMKLEPGRAESQLMVSAIGKYIPGNFAHLIGRYALAQEDRLPGWAVGFSMVVEVGLLLGAGALIFALALVFAPDLVLALLPDETLISPKALVLGLGLALMVGLLGGGALFRRRLDGPRRGMAHPMRAIAPFGLHAVNFLVLGLSLYCVARVVAPGSTVGLLPSVAIFAAAWCIGFITPGAPGGLGLREGIIALGLGLFLGAGPALAAALLHRLISVIGDLITFPIGLYLRRGKGNGGEPSAQEDLALHDLRPWT